MHFAWVQGPSLQASWRCKQSTFALKPVSNETSLPGPEFVGHYASSCGSGLICLGEELI